MPSAPVTVSRELSRPGNESPPCVQNGRVSPEGCRHTYRPPQPPNAGLMTLARPLSMSHRNDGVSPSWMQQGWG